MRRRIREFHDIKAEIRGHPAEYRRQARSRSVVDALDIWLEDHIGRVIAASGLAEGKNLREAIDLVKSSETKRHQSPKIAFQASLRRPTSPATVVTFVP